MSTAEIAAIEMAGAGAMLALSAALGGTGAALAGIGNLAVAASDWMQDRADSMQARLDLAQRCESLVREVLDRHARIDALADAVERARRDRGITAVLALPQPLCYEGQDPGQLEAWCASTDTALAAAEEALSGAIAQALTAGLMMTSTQDALVTDTGATQAPDARAELAATLTRVLSRLSPDVIPADVEAIQAAAARVVAAESHAEAHSRLTDVRVRVQQASERAVAQREDVLRAARCLRLLSGYQAPGVDDMRAALADVVAGRRELEDAALAGTRQELYAQAEALAAQAQADRERRYLAAILEQALDDLGYRLGEGFETLTAADGDAFITRGDWPSHAVKVRLADDHELRFAMVRTAPATTRQDQRLDAEREQAWCESFERVRAALTDRGISSDVRWRLEPGTQQLPVAHRRATGSATAPLHRVQQRDKDHRR